jgi:hypothetical protein
MSADLEQRIRSGLREYADAPAISPPSVYAIMNRPTRGRLAALRSTLAPALAAAAVLAVVVLASAAVPDRGTPGVGPGAYQAPQIPTTFAPFSFLTGDLAAAPIDRAVAAYVQRNDAFEDWGQDWQLVLLDSDGVQYRRTRVADPLPAGFGSYPDGTAFQTFLLSPDGRRVAIGGAPNGRYGLSVLDVATGGMTIYELPNAANTRPLAWSPDGHQLAYVTTTPDSSSGALTIFDLTTGEDDPQAGNVSSFAFSPDGSGEAVQEGNYITVKGSDPPVVPPFIRVTADQRIAGWSPDGHLLALMLSDLVPDGHGGTARRSRALRFISADGSPGYVPGDLHLDPTASFVGWRGDSVVIWDGVRLSAVPIGGGPVTTLAETGAGVSALQLATGLLPTATFVQPGRVDRGPWPRWARLAVGLPLGTLAAAALLFVWWRARRRSAQLST